MVYYQIYSTINKINGKVYIGQHKQESRKQDDYLGSGKLLHRAIKKYGADNFEKNILEVCENREQANFLEKKYIWFYRLGGSCQYNLADGGTGGNLGEEVRKRGADTLKQRYKNKEIIPPMLGKKHSEDSKRKIGLKSKSVDRKYMLGRKLSEDTRRKLSESLMGNIPWNKGKTGVYSEETKQKISESLKGKVRAPEAVEKTANANRGKERTEEIRNKISETNKNKRWFNNGIEHVFVEECPDGFMVGMLKRKYNA